MDRGGDWTDGGLTGKGRGDGVVAWREWLADGRGWFAERWKGEWWGSGRFGSGRWLDCEEGVALSGRGFGGSPGWSGIGGLGGLLREADDV